jgi:hypothetical protein
MIHSPKERYVMKANVKAARRLNGLFDLIELQNAQVTRSLKSLRETKTLATSSELIGELAERERQLRAVRPMLARLAEYYDAGKAAYDDDNFDLIDKEMGEAIVVYKSVLRVLAEDAKRDETLEAKFGLSTEAPAPKPEKAEERRTVPPKPSILDGFDEEVAAERARDTKKKVIPSPPVVEERPQPVPEATPELTEVLRAIEAQKTSCDNGFNQLNRRIDALPVSTLPAEYAAVLMDYSPAQLAAMLDMAATAAKTRERLRRPMRNRSNNRGDHRS